PYLNSRTLSRTARVTALSRPTTRGDGDRRGSCGPMGNRATRGSGTQRRRGVLVSHPVKQHSWATARTLQRAGLLQAYVTSINYDPGWGPYRLLPLLPRRLSARLLKELKKREVRIDDRRAVSTPGLWPLLFAGARPVMRGPAMASQLQWLLDASF